MRKLALAALMMAGLTAAPREVSFPTADGGVIRADLYGTGDRGVVLAHGARFDKASWGKQAEVLAKAGFRVLAIDFRGYGQSRGGDKSAPGSGEKYEDILAAVRYLRENGAKTVSVIGASMGGGAAAKRRSTRAPAKSIASFCWLPCRWRSPSGLPARSYSSSAGGTGSPPRSGSNSKRRRSPKS